MAYCKVAQGYKHKKRRTRCSGKPKNACIRAMACTWTGTYRSTRRGRKKGGRGHRKSRTGCKCTYNPKSHRCRKAKR